MGIFISRKHTLPKVIRLLLPKC